MRVLIAGGGVAALEAGMALRRFAEERVEIELLAPNDRFRYRPMAVAEPFGLGEARGFDLAEIAADHSFGLRADSLVGVDVEERQARTRSGDAIEYDTLIVATGARAREGFPHALTFSDDGGRQLFERLLQEIDDGTVHRIAFASRTDPGWPLPLYELALMTAEHAATRGVERLHLTFTTPEDAPMAAFGHEASSRVARLLEKRGIEVLCGVLPAAYNGVELRLVPDDRLRVERLVCLPELEGPGLAGLPQDEHGFIPIDEHGRVRGVEGVFAAGDSVSFPIKHGGLAAQQADAIAQVIARDAGVKLEPKPFRPILRGLLLTGREPSYMRAEITGGSGETSMVASQPLWWPPGKIVGTYLAPYLATLDADLAAHEPAGESIEIEADFS
jgi:sulfide:quinone oxidoreductase